MNDSKRKDQNGPPLSVTMVTTGNSFPVSGSTGLASTSGWVAEHLLVIGQGQLDRVDRVVLVTGRPDVEGMFVLGPVVPASGQPPGPTAGGLELAEVQSPNLVRPAGLGSERDLAPLSEPTPLPLILRGQDQPLVTQDTQHTRLGEHVPVMADHRPDLPVPPRRMSQRVSANQLPGSLPCRFAAKDPCSVPRCGPWPASGAKSARACQMSWQNLTVDMPASTRITSRSSKSPAGPQPTSSKP